RGRREEGRARRLGAAVEAAVERIAADRVADGEVEIDVAGVENVVDVRRGDRVGDDDVVIIDGRREAGQEAWGEHRADGNRPRVLGLERLVPAEGDVDLARRGRGNVA